MNDEKNIAESLKKKFRLLFGQQPLIVQSPGRINIIGEHTDYNEGFVLPAAIDKAAYMAVAIRNDNEIHLIADDLNEKFSININELQPQKNISWPNYILGPVAQLLKKNIVVTGFNAILSSNVPVGAGLSSSAAVECATIFALNELFHAKLDKITMIKMAQKAEHEYPGLLCGIMDMFASVMGKKDHVIKLDCRSLEYEYVPFKLDGIKVVLFDTNVKHSLASSEYNTRRKECTQAVEWVKEFHPEVKTLRDVTEAMLDKYVLPKNKLIDKRSRFVVQEIQRLQDACDDLKRGDIAALGNKMFATHDGLSRMYEVSCAELDFLVDFVKNNEDVIGARMMGGGFGGCTINLVRESAIDPLIEKIKPAYEQKTNLPFTFYIDSIGDGTGIAGGVI